MYPCHPYLLQNPFPDSSQAWARQQRVSMYLIEHIFDWWRDAEVLFEIVQMLLPWGVLCHLDNFSAGIHTLPLLHGCLHNVSGWQP